MWSLPFTMCWDSEARFRICDYQIFDQGGFSLRTWKRGKERREASDEYSFVNDNMLKISKERALCENSKNYFRPCHSCTIFHIFKKKKSCLMFAKEVIIKRGWKRHSCSPKWNTEHQSGSISKAQHFCFPVPDASLSSSRRWRLANLYSVILRVIL